MRTTILRLCLAALTLMGIMVSPVAAQVFTLSGTVSDAALAPISGVDVFLYDDQGNPIGIPLTVTDALGFYSIAGVPAGTYGLEFQPSTTTNYLPVMVTGIVVTTNTTVNAVLPLGFRLSGFVTDGSVGLPNIDLNVYDQATGDKLTTPGDNTDSVGFYDVVIPAGVYRLRWRTTDGTPLVPVEIQNVPITKDTTVSIVMHTGFTVSGTITGPGSVPVFDADLDFIDTTTGQVLFTPGDNTDASGFYAVVIPAGVYDVDVEPLAVDRLVAKRTPGVTITRDTTVDIALDAGYLLSGTVRNSVGTGIGGVDLDVHVTATGTLVLTPADNTDPAGVYGIIVPSGTFDIEYAAPVAARLAAVELLSVPVSKDTVIDVTLPNGFLLSGTVRNAFGVPVPTVDLDAVDTTTGLSVPLPGGHTDDTGGFVVVLAPGVYDMQFEPLKSRRLAAMEFPATTVAFDQVFPVTLDTGVLVSGFVRDSANVPLFDIDLDALLAGSPTRIFTPSDNTDLTGYYEVVLPVDSYDLIYRKYAGLAVLDSVVLASVPVAHDTAINVTFAGGSGGGTWHGDVNNDGTITASDIIYMVAYVFKGGPPPQPTVDNGDTNCDGSTTSADIIFLVAYVFRGGPAPVCP